MISLLSSHGWKKEKRQRHRKPETKIEVKHTPNYGPSTVTAEKCNRALKTKRPGKGDKKREIHILHDIFRCKPSQSIPPRPWFRAAAQHTRTVRGAYAHTTPTTRAAPSTSVPVRIRPPSHPSRAEGHQIQHVLRPRLPPSKPLASQTACCFSAQLSLLLLLLPERTLTLTHLRKTRAQGGSAGATRKAGPTNDTSLGTGGGREEQQPLLRSWHQRAPWMGCRWGGSSV